MGRLPYSVWQYLVPGPRCLCEFLSKSLVAEMLLAELTDGYPATQRIFGSTSLVLALVLDLLGP